MCECGRRTSSWIGLTPKVHGRDKTGVHSEYVENFAGGAESSAATSEKQVPITVPSHHSIRAETIRDISASGRRPRRK
jgi:hypothetical protein